jgi:hypothetical protein
MLLDETLDAMGGKSGIRQITRARSSKRRLNGVRILVVEDNLINQQVAEELLMAEGAIVSLAAHFSDRGRLFQADRGRRFNAIVDAQGMRASEGLNVSQPSMAFEDGNREASGLSPQEQTYPRRRAALATYRPTRWVSRLWRGDGCAHWSFPGSRSVAPLSAMR